MPPTEKQMFLQTWNMEVQTTTKVLRAYPSDQLDFRPHERSRSARDLAWTFVLEQGMIDMVLAGKIDFSAPSPPAPQTLDQILSVYQQNHAEKCAKVEAMSEETYQSEMAFPVGPRQMGKFRRADVLWITVMDMVHHRGQLSVYLRMAGGKVPSIYGPSADEPWM